jgi:TPR repeat protein
LTIVVIAVLASFWWWPIAIRFKDDWVITNAHPQLEAFDRELWGKSVHGTEPKWTLRFAEKLLYGQSEERLKNIGVLLLQRLIASDNFQAAKSLATYFGDEKYGALDQSASIKFKNISRNLIEKQVKEGSAPAMWALAQMHFEGKEIELNVKRAHELFIGAADKDPAEFGKKLGDLFQYGHSGFDRSFSDAFNWYKKSASAGGVESKAKAALAIGMLEWKAKDAGELDDQKENWNLTSARLYKEAADLGDPYSMYRVASGMLSGDKYFRGDASQGKSWLKKAVAANEPNALVLTALTSTDIGQKNIPSNVEDLLLKAWKLEIKDSDTPHSEFVKNIWSDVLVKLGVFSLDGDHLVGTIDPVRFNGWINAYYELESKQRSYRFANAKDIKLADQLTDQILAIANSKTLPNEWPKLNSEIAPTNNFIPFFGDLDKGTIPKPETGYLKGEKQLFAGGLSSFTIDNTTGGNDAEVRLYLNGNQVRSLYIRVGTKFTAEKLAPGTYKMRYKITADGKTRVYEAKEQFVLSETKTENGTRFSRMTVTLFTVKDGNMQMDEVPMDRF